MIIKILPGFITEKLGVLNNKKSRVKYIINKSINLTLRINKQKGLSIRQHLKFTEAKIYKQLQIKSKMKEKWKEAKYKIKA